METKTTNDYSIFKTLEGNRAVNDKRVKKIIESIQRVGWIHCPIIVNDKMEIIDGQGRLEALRRLGMPVEYMVVPGTTIDDCRAMNDTATTWVSREFVESFATTGNKSYQRLKQMMDMYEVDVRIVLRAMNRAPKDMKKVKSGEFVMEDLDFGRGLKMLPIYKGYWKVMQRFNGAGRAKWTAIFFLAEGSYPHQELIDFMANCDPAVIWATTTERFLETLENEWNRHHKRAGNKFYFLEDYRRK